MSRLLESTLQQLAKQVYVQSFEIYLFTMFSEGKHI